MWKGKETKERGDRAKERVIEGVNEIKAHRNMSLQNNLIFYNID
jgi:hypothetical protein